MIHLLLELDVTLQISVILVMLLVLLAMDQIILTAYLAIQIPS